MRSSRACEVTEEIVGKALRRAPASRQSCRPRHPRCTASDGRRRLPTTTVSATRAAGTYRARGPRTRCVAADLLQTDYIEPSLPDPPAPRPTPTSDGDRSGAVTRTCSCTPVADQPLRSSSRVGLACSPACPPERSINVTTASESGRLMLTSVAPRQTTAARDGAVRHRRADRAPRLRAHPPRSGRLCSATCRNTQRAGPAPAGVSTDPRIDQSLDVTGVRSHASPSGSREGHYRRRAESMHPGLSSDVSTEPTARAIRPGSRARPADPALAPRVRRATWSLVAPGNVCATSRPLSRRSPPRRSCSTRRRLGGLAPRHAFVVPITSPVSFSFDADSWTRRRPIKITLRRRTSCSTTVSLSLAPSA